MMRLISGPPAGFCALSVAFAINRHSIPLGKQAAQTVMQCLPYALNNRHRGIIGMTRVSTRGENQFVIASPKTVPISYQQSRVKMQREYVFLFRGHDHEFLEQIKPRQQIVYSSLYCNGPIISPGSSLRVRHLPDRALCKIPQLLATSARLIAPGKIWRLCTRLVRQAVRATKHRDTTLRWLIWNRQIFVDDTAGRAQIRRC